MTSFIIHLWVWSKDNESIVIEIHFEGKLKAVGGGTFLFFSRESIFPHWLQLNDSFSFSSCVCVCVCVCVCIRGCVHVGWKSGRWPKDHHVSPSHVRARLEEGRCLFLSLASGVLQFMSWMCCRVVWSSCGCKQTRMRPRSEGLKGTRPLVQLRWFYLHR